MGITTYRPLERTHEVEAPYHERPSDGNHLQSASWEVGLFGVKLASAARTNKLDGVSDGRWLVETLSKGVADEGSGSCVVAASPQVYILEVLPSLLHGDAALQDPHRASTVQLFAFAWITYDLARQAIRSSSNSPWIRQLRKGVRQSDGRLGCRECCSTSIASAMVRRASIVLTGLGAGASMAAPTP